MNSPSSLLLAGKEKVFAEGIGEERQGGAFGGEWEITVPLAVGASGCRCCNGDFEGSLRVLA